MGIAEIADKNPHRPKNLCGEFQEPTLAAAFRQERWLGLEVKSHERGRSRDCRKPVRISVALSTLCDSVKPLLRGGTFRNKGQENKRPASSLPGAERRRMVIQEKMARLKDCQCARSLIAVVNPDIVLALEVQAIRGIGKVPPQPGVRRRLHQDPVACALGEKGLAMERF